MIPEGKSGKRRYGCWAGRPNGRGEDVMCCIEQIHRKHTTILGQCSKKRGFGPNGEFCKQHARFYENIDD